MERKMKHLEMIEGVINRMASNSFALKGWTVTLVAGILALMAKDAEKAYFVVIYIPIVAFWFLDSYYLLQERCNRSLYEKVCNTEVENIDFSLDASVFKDVGKNCYHSCLFSKTERAFYIPLALVGVVVIMIA